MQLTRGGPPEPSTLDKLDVKRIPYGFLDVLFLVLTGIDTRHYRILERSVDREWSVVRGRSGTDEVGYDWKETTCLETQALPQRVTVKTHGLPGIEISWSWTFEKVGQAGFAGYAPGRLRVRFLTVQARREFEVVWAKIFGYLPEFTPEYNIPT